MVYIVVLVGAYFLVVGLEGLSEGFEKEVFFSKAVYEYERFYVPVPRRFNDMVKPFLGEDLEISVERRDNGFLLHARVRRRSRSYSIYEVLLVRVEGCRTFRHAETWYV